MELLLGCGGKREKQLCFGGRKEWSQLVTLDMNADHKPDVVHDLVELPLPFAPDQFDEIHAYDVLEHTGQQGDFRFFFRQWQDFWRILKPGGMLFGTSPHMSSPWAWGDPCHTRVMSSESFVFLHQPAYAAQVGVTPMSDYRFCYAGDFDLVHSRVTEIKQLEYVLRAVKPARIAA